MKKAAKAEEDGSEEERQLSPDASTSLRVFCLPPSFFTSVLVLLNSEMKSNSFPIMVTISATKEFERSNR